MGGLRSGKASQGKGTWYLGDPYLLPAASPLDRFSIGSQHIVATFLSRLRRLPITFCFICTM